MAIDITPNTPILATGTGFEQGKNYFFFDATAQQPPYLYQNIIGSAKTKIVIWDTHFMENYDPELFKSVACDNLQIMIFTAYHREQDIDSLKTFFQNIKVALSSHANSCKISIRSVKWNSYNKYMTKISHDRYLIVDDDVYLIGASMNNQIQSYHSHGIYKLNDQEDRDLIIRKFKEYWNRSISEHTADKRSNISGIGWIN